MKSKYKNIQNEISFRWVSIYVLLRLCARSILTSFPSKCEENRRFNKGEVTPEYSSHKWTLNLRWLFIVAKICPSSSFICFIICFMLCHLSNKCFDFYFPWCSFHYELYHTHICNMVCNSPKCRLNNLLLLTFYKLLEITVLLVLRQVHCRRSLGTGYQPVVQCLMQNQSRSWNV